ncbi:O-antigen ligase family protein [Psychrobacter sp. JCM 18901]|uniref:O-antigen ligase family protein n=1 Tax=Psychrobacter sp. JCM 18901 TaxID=1298609 RepID=UPI0021C2A01B|nr:O-antigen ligase family protein [Psychrobacter sp. JCM 18901]
MSTGVALSSSRGGLILIIASLFFYILSTKGWATITKNIMVVCTAMFLGYIFGLYLLDIYVQPTTADAVTRMSEGSLYLRVEQFQQAWMQFKYHQFTGVGLGNLLADSLEHINEMKWFVFFYA